MRPGPAPGGGEGFGESAELHRALLLRVALRLSGDREIAKDLVQETLFRGLSRFAQFQPGTRAETWLVTILTHVFYDQLRHEKVVNKAAPELAVVEAVECDSTDAEVSDADLYAAVQALEPELREVVELCYLKDLRYREAGEILKLPTGTIGTRLIRARERLRMLLSSAKSR